MAKANSTKVWTIVAGSGNTATQYNTALPSSANWYSMAYGNGVFVLVSSDTTDAAVSNDGVTWSSVTLPSLGTSWYFQTVIFASGRFFIVGRGNTSYGLFSTDGQNWTQKLLPQSGNWSAPGCINNTYVAFIYDSNLGTYISF